MKFNNSIEELNKLEEQIRETQNFLEENSIDKQQISKLKEQRSIFALLALLFFITSLWLYYFYNISKNSFNNKQNKYLLQVNKDSIDLYKNSTILYKDSVKLFNELEINRLKSELGKNLNEEKVVYNIQLAAFQDYKITTSNINKISKKGYNKLSVGNYTKYKDVKKMKKNLKQIGFRDCFIVAHSFGNRISIEEALALSDEKEFISK